jgi:hypothetical protein
LATAAPAAQHGFAADLSAALQLSDKAYTVKTDDTRLRIFDDWCDFCTSLRQKPDLSQVRDEETKLCYLLVFGLRIRAAGCSNSKANEPVRAGTVEDALLAVGKGITNLGEPDPRKEVPGSKSSHPPLGAFLKAMRDEDDPASRSYPVNVTLIRQLFDTLDYEHEIHGQANRHVIDLVIVGHFWLLRPAECLHGAAEGRSQAFRLADISFIVNGKHYAAADPSLNDLNINAHDYASLTFNDQKNGVRGEQVGHKATSDPELCPCKALARLAQHLRDHDAPITTPISAYWDSHGNKHLATSKLVTNGLRHAACAIQDLTGINPSLISTRSLRPGGATALLCAGVDKDIIQLLGRWKSDAMFRCLRIQATAHSGNFAQRMLDHGTHTFAPQVPKHPGELSLPNQIPAGFIEAMEGAHI